KHTLGVAGVPATAGGWRVGGTREGAIAAAIYGVRLVRCPHCRQDEARNELATDEAPAAAAVAAAVGRDHQLELRKHHYDLTAVAERGEPTHRVIGNSECLRPPTKAVIPVADVLQR